MEQEGPFAKEDRISLFDEVELLLALLGDGERVEKRGIIFYVYAVSCEI